MKNSIAGMAASHLACLFVLAITVAALPACGKKTALDAPAFTVEPPQEPAVRAEHTNG